MPESKRKKVIARTPWLTQLGGWYVNPDDDGYFNAWFCTESVEREYVIPEGCKVRLFISNAPVNGAIKSEIKWTSHLIFDLYRKHFRFGYKDFNVNQFVWWWVETWENWK